MQSVFLYLEPCRLDSRLCRTDRRIDIVVVNVALNYVAQPKIKHAVADPDTQHTHTKLDYFNSLYHSVRPWALAGMGKRGHLPRWKRD